MKFRFFSKKIYSRSPNVHWMALQHDLHENDFVLFGEELQILDEPRIREAFLRDCVDHENCSKIPSSIGKEEMMVLIRHQVQLMKFEV